MVFGLKNKKTLDNYRTVQYTLYTMGAAAVLCIRLGMRFFRRHGWLDAYGRYGMMPEWSSCEASLRSKWCYSSTKYARINSPTTVTPIAQHLRNRFSIHRPISFIRIKHRTRANDNLCKYLMYHAACKVEFQPFTW